MNRRTFAASFLFMACGGARAQRGLAAIPDGDESLGPLEPQARPNLAMPTLGGRQFWGDELFFHQWRIQRNALTGHCRLLDGDKRRRAWGSFEQCQAKLEDVKHRQKLPPMSGRAVILMHGLFRSGAAMAGLSRYLQTEGDYTVFNVTYPTTRSSIPEHAERLAGIVRTLDGIEELNFVGHSMGNLVIRCYLGGPDAASGRAPDARIKRMVMLAPPNNGARMAEMLDHGKLFHLVAGEPGRELARGWPELSRRLVTPGCEFGIIAGGLGNARGYNPLLGEDNDMVVSVTSTRLPGAADFAVVPVIHSLIMDDPRVQAFTLRFLQRGYFISRDLRQPVCS